MTATQSPPDIGTVQALRLDMAHQIAREVARLGLTQLALAKRLDVPQPTLSKIVNGDVSALSLELLVRIAVRAGLQITLQTGRTPAEAGAFISGTAYRISRSHSSALASASREGVAQFERLLTPAQRLDAFLQHNQLLAEIHLAGARATVARLQQVKQP